MGDTRNRILLRASRFELRGLGWLALSVALTFGVVTNRVEAQNAPALNDVAPQDVSEDADLKGETQPLSLRYRFTQRYVESADPTQPAWLTQYQVGVREKVKVVREKPQGAPDRAETTLQTIYTERVMKTNPNRSASDMVRRYDQARITTTLPTHRSFRNPEFLEQLSIWYRLKPGKPPEIFNLSDGRILRQAEFDRVIKNPFLPQLASLLPTNPRRVGDRWPVPRASIGMLLGETPMEEGYEVEAELIEVRAANPGSTLLTAVLGIKGQLDILEGPVALHVRAHFSFEAPKPETESSDQPVAKKQSGVVDADGWISEIRLAEVLTTPLPEDETGRLKQTMTRELVVALRARPEELGVAAALPLVAPEAPPEDPAHTWVTFEDPESRYHLAHPQGLRIARTYPDGGVDLVDRRFDGQDVISLVLLPKSGDASQDRLAADPTEQRKSLAEQWRAQNQEVLMGDSGWLRGDVWEPLNRKVYRIEAALKPAGESPAIRSNRIYLDRYIVQFTRNETMIVTAMTTRDPHVPFRDQAEQIIKSFQFGSAEGAPLSPP